MHVCIFTRCVQGLRPEIRQYFIEADNESVPFSRAQRSVVYQRAKKQVSQYLNFLQSHTAYQRDTI
jgi:hypothetical protein